jgi:hypothetical protein
MIAIGTHSQHLKELSARIAEKCKEQGWSKDWIRGGCYIHLECSEFIESLRGKGDDPPEKEAADVLFTFLAVAGHYDLDIDAILGNLDRLINGK